MKNDGLHFFMSKAFVFPGQSSQKLGMGKDLYEKSPKARAIFEQANDILGERFSDFLFNASEDVLMDTRYTQPAIFIYQVAAALGQNAVQADCTAGHSLGEYAAVVVAGALSFEECLPFIKFRGQVFYDAFQRNPSAMGAVIALPDELVRNVLKQVSEEDGNNLYVANYNGPGQLVITGALDSVKKACKILKGLGAKRALVLPQKGVGHSPNSAEEGRILGEALKMMHWMTPRIPIYQDAVIDDTLWKTIKAQFVQVRRWYYGASDVAYVGSRLFGPKSKRGMSFWRLFPKFWRFCQSYPNPPNYYI